MPFRDDIKDYRRSAVRRLEDARELLEAPTLDPNRSDAGNRHLRGAMYLAGYAVECMAKAYIIQYLNAQTLASAVDRLNEQRGNVGKDSVKNIAGSAAGHNISYLLQLSDLPNTADFDQRLWGRVGRWRSSWRYETDAVSRSAASEFLDDVEAVVNWLAPEIAGG